MMSRGKRLVSLVIKNNEIDTDISSTIEFPDHANTFIESLPSCSNYREKKYMDDDVEKELESLFGDVSDTDDPTYRLPEYSHQLENEDSNGLVTLKDLLGNKENESVQYFDIQEIQNNIKIIEQNKVQYHESMVVVEEILTELFKKSWLLIEPSKRWRKSNPNNWARNVAKKRRADGLPYQIKAKSRPAKKRNDLNCFDAKDRRGAHEPVNKTKPDIIQGIRKHIESFPCMAAHYSKKDTQRKYLDKNLNIRKMHLLYRDECLKNGSEPASEITYRRIFSKEYNLSFFVPRKDQCLVCTNYAQAETEKKRELEDAYNAHQERKKICNREKEKDKVRSNTDEHFSSVTFDLQSVLQIPSCDVGLLYYSRKLCVYNLTIYEAALPNNAYCFSWSEVNGRKGSSEIGSILLHYFSNCVPENIKEISLFSDTCGGQNRNQYVSALLLWAVQKINNLRVIEQKFLESGHTQMEADSMHSSIESAKKNNSVFSMMDWISIFKRARRRQTIKVDGKIIIREPYRVKEFKFDEFFDLKHLANTLMKNRTKDDKGKQVQWLKIKRIRYVKGQDRKIFFNYDMSDNFNFIEIQEKSTSSTFQSGLNHAYSTRNKKRSTENYLAAVNLQFPDQLNRLYQEQLEISEAKKKDLISLCNKLIIPEELHGWFISLKTSKQIVDKLPEPAVDEVESGEDE
ncbi:unnamed protein product, partial [Brenthis ino]